VVISFEDLTDAGSREEGARVVVTSQYAKRGVVFNGPAAFNYDKTGGVLGFAHSPSRAVERCVGREFREAPFVLAPSTASEGVGRLFGSSRPGRNCSPVRPAPSRVGRPQRPCCRPPCLRRPPSATKRCPPPRQLASGADSKHYGRGKVATLRVRLLHGRAGRYDQRPASAERWRNRSRPAAGLVVRNSVSKKLDLLVASNAASR